MRARRFVLLLGNVLSRVLGLVREQTIAYLFGASAATDSFVAATQVPTMVYDLLLGGAVTAAFGFPSLPTMRGMTVNSPRYWVLCSPWRVWCLAAR